MASEAQNQNNESQPQAQVGDQSYSLPWYIQFFLWSQLLVFEHEHEHEHEHVLFLSQLKKN